VYPVIHIPPSYSDGQLADVPAIITSGHHYFSNSFYVLRTKRFNLFYFAINPSKKIYQSLVQDISTVGKTVRFKTLLPKCPVCGGQEKITFVTIVSNIWDFMKPLKYANRYIRHIYFELKTTKQHR